MQQKITAFMKSAGPDGIAAAPTNICAGSPARAVVALNLHKNSFSSGTIIASNRLLPPPALSAIPSAHASHVSRRVTVLQSVDRSAENVVATPPGVAMSSLFPTLDLDDAVVAIKEELAKLVKYYDLITLLAISGRNFLSQKDSNFLQAFLFRISKGLGLKSLKKPYRGSTEVFQKSRACAISTKGSRTTLLLKLNDLRFRVEQNPTHIKVGVAQQAHYDLQFFQCYCPPTVHQRGACEVRVPEGCVYSGAYCSTLLHGLCAILLQYFILC
eukprot:TRINITY_DN15542_c0_g2_i1.p1 TRINITY_DN15542_c0_g2~~TRINITY_DN15542_c0_g2_i1.p1  ORF type:complete len:271 (-),score=5.14 TRINITY_DN15542_c0_g2_i1:62-874(-)